MRILSAGLLPFLLIACGTSASDKKSASGSEGLQAGQWTLSTSLGTPQTMGSGREPPLTVPICLDAAEAE